MCPAPTASASSRASRNLWPTRGCRCPSSRRRPRARPTAARSCFSLSGVMLSKDRVGVESDVARSRAASLAARRDVDGVAARVSRRPSRRWRRGVGLSPLLASMASWVSSPLGHTHRLISGARQRGQARARLQGPRARDGREHRHVRLRRRRGREDGRLGARQPLSRGRRGSAPHP